MAFKLRAPFLNTEDEEENKGVLSTGTVIRPDKSDKQGPEVPNANSLTDNSFKKSEDVNAGGVETTVEEKEKGSGNTLEDLEAEIDPEKGFNANLKRRIDEASNAREKQRRENRLERKEERQETSTKKKKAKHESKMDNPAKKARKLVKAKNQETRLAEKKKRQQERAKTIMKKNFGSEENAKEFEESLTVDEDAPTNYMASAMDLQDNSDVEGAMEKAKKAAPTKAVGAIASLAAPIIKQAAVGAISNKMQEKMESPNNYKPNRAGGPLNRNELQMSPVLKTYKQSHSGAVGMMKMQNIAQDPGPANMNEGFEALPDDVQDKILKNDK